MFQVLSVFYPTHYNFGVLCILLVILIIWLLTKKNYKWSLIILVVLLAINIAVFKRTDGKSWTITIEGDKNSSEAQIETQKYTFSAEKNWTITDSKGQVHHWCWVEDWWEKFSSLDLVASIWGDNKSKKMMKATEERLNGNVDN